MNNLEAIYEAVTGRRPSDEDRQRLLRYGAALGLTDRDEVWKLVIMLDDISVLVSKAPIQLSAAVSEAVKAARQQIQTSATAEVQRLEAEVKRAHAEAKRNLAEAVRTAAIDSAAAAAGRSRARWTFAVLALACVLLALAFGGGWYFGETAGRAEAEEVYGTANMELLMRCEGKGWQQKHRGEDGWYCFPHAADGMVAGWKIPRPGILEIVPEIIP